jgi:rSAM/selenodomain-associated transferase 1
MMCGSNGNQQKRRALVVVAKPAVVGEVKTRLCPPLTLPQACALYECLLLDIVTKVEEYQTAELWIAFAPKGEEYFGRIFAGKKRLLRQRGSDLGERLHHIFVDLFHIGYQQIVVTDSDSPTVPLSSIAKAYELLDGERCDVVLGPSSDGGYYLVGLKCPTEELFHRIPWSSAAVVEKSLERASELGLTAALLPLAYDIDVEADLKRLWEDLKASPELQERALKSYAFLSRLFREPDQKGTERTFRLLRYDKGG